jgi:FAD:protein FMN transferase
MGTAVSFTSLEDLRSSALIPACEWLRWVEATFSTFLEESQINQIHRGSLSAADAHPLVVEVLDLCDDLFVRSNGIFDPYARGRLDPAGVVKGWAIERTASILRREGVENFTINGGGDVVTRGRRTIHDAWRSGVRHPVRANEIVRVVEHREGLEAIATSGTYERGHHIADTRTGSGLGLAPSCLSATVTGPSLLWADAYATIVFILGVDGLAWLADQGDEYEGYVIVDEFGATSTPGFPPSV